jgi:gas vesicle protein
MSRLDVFMFGVLCGGAAGLTLGLLSAPKSGDEIRKNLLDASEQIYRKAAYELEELAEHIDEVRHKADVIEANDSLEADPVISRAQDALREASQTTAESQQVLWDTSPRGSSIS